MIISLRNISVFYLVLVLGVTPGSAQTTWKADSADSKIQFTVGNLLVTKVTGRFKVFDISLVQVNKDFSNSDVDATIQVNSIDTDNDKRDAHLRSADFFDANRMPTITFKSTSFTSSGEDRFQITGDLTIHGVTKEIVLDTKSIGQAIDSSGTTDKVFSAVCVLNRKDFNIGGGFLVGTDVEIQIVLKMQKI